MENKRNTSDNSIWILIMAVFVFFMIMGKKSNTQQSSYVKPYYTHSGKMVKGHTRKKHSTSATAYKSRQNSKSYYHRHPYRGKLLHSNK